MFVTAPVILFVWLDSIQSELDNHDSGIDKSIFFFIISTQSGASLGRFDQLIRILNRPQQWTDLGPLPPTT